MQREFVFSGVGGQGILVASQLVGHAALAEGKRAMYFSMFMGAQRGGTCECLVVVADDRVNASPVILQPLTGNISMHPNAFLRFEKVVRPGGLIVYNTSITRGSSDTNAQTGMGMALKADANIDLKPNRDDIAYMGVPATTLAIEEIGNPLMATLVAVGAFVELTGIVSVQSAQEALPEALPEHRHPLIPFNARALEIGAHYARERGTLVNADCLTLVGRQAARV
jgi:2-oxoglutarate ferredoxin oxidoreductase subunit gamma